jgi:hypothetical protein
MAMSPLVIDTPSSSSSRPDATKLPGSRPAAIAATPAPITPFFKNDRRFALSLAKISDCFIRFSPLVSRNNEKQHRIELQRLVGRAN